MLLLLQAEVADLPFVALDRGEGGSVLRVEVSEVGAGKMRGGHGRQAAREQVVRGVDGGHRHGRNAAVAVGVHGQGEGGGGGCVAADGAGAAASQAIAQRLPLEDLPS